MYSKCPYCGWVQKVDGPGWVECRSCFGLYRFRPRKRKLRLKKYSDSEDERRRRMWGSYLAWRYVIRDG
jgi:hypothetical protein